MDLIGNRLDILPSSRKMKNDARKIKNEHLFTACWLWSKKGLDCAFPIWQFFCNINLPNFVRLNCLNNRFSMPLIVIYVNSFYLKFVAINFSSFFSLFCLTCAPRQLTTGDNQLQILSLSYWETALLWLRLLSSTKVYWNGYAISPGRSWNMWISSITSGP